MENFRKILLKFEYTHFLLATFGAPLIPIILGKILGWPEEVGYALFLLIMAFQLFFMSQNTQKEYLLRMEVKALKERVRNLESELSAIEDDSKIEK